MRKERQVFSQNWEDLRADIENIIRGRQINARDFRPLGIHEDWQAIEENIYKHFCRLDHPKFRPVWLWEYFKRDQFTVVTEQPHTLLPKLLDPDETVWFFVNGDKDKLWFYEGKSDTIITIVEESCYIDELYLASKKYEWLICINHHDNLIATGDTMPDKLKRLGTSTERP